MSKWFFEGDRIQISGDSADLWLHDYSVRVDTEGTVLETAAPNDKKVFVSIDSIDGEQNVYAYVRKSRIKPVPLDLSSASQSLNDVIQSALSRVASTPPRPRTQKAKRPRT